MSGRALALYQGCAGVGVGYSFDLKHVVIFIFLKDRLKIITFWDIWLGRRPSRRQFLCTIAVGALVGLVAALRKLLFVHISSGCAHWVTVGLGKQILCIFTVGALIWLALGRLEEADFIHIYGGCAHWACSWRCLRKVFYACLWWVRSLGLGLAVSEKADFMHIYGRCAQWAWSWQTWGG